MANEKDVRYSNYDKYPFFLPLHRMIKKKRLKLDDTNNRQAFQIIENSKKGYLSEIIKNLLSKLFV